MLSYIDKIQQPGFSFDNEQRNTGILTQEQLKKTFVKTGTTICGVVCKDGVVIAADTRATQHYVADKNCNKIHYITENIVCCGAGTAADNYYHARKLSAELELMQMNFKRQVKVKNLVCKSSTTLAKYGGQIGAYQIYAGYDSEGPHLVQCDATGFVQYSPFLCMGSGSINAYAELEHGYRDNLTVEQGKELAIRAITAGIIYDLGSGSNVDLMIITQKGRTHLRNYIKVEQRKPEKEIPYLIYKNNFIVLLQQKEMNKNYLKSQQMDLE